MAGTHTRIINGIMRTVRVDGSLSLAAGVTSGTVTFPLALQTGNTTPPVTAWLIDITDTNPQYQPVTITAYSSTAFTASWNDPTSSANYILYYNVADGWLA